MNSIKALGTKIPTLFPHNHASNILPLKNGDILCVWFGGSREGRADISVLCSRLEKNSSSWSQPIVLSNDSKKSEQNPLLFEDFKGRIWLVYTAQDSIHQNSAIVRYRISEDFGYSWSEISTLFDKPGSFVRHPAIQLDNGELLLPAYYSLKSDTGFLGRDYSVVKISSDNGATWNEFKVENSIGLVHMSVVKLSSDELIAFFRSRKADYIYTSKSNDYGRTWSEPIPTNLPNNNASIQCIKLINGHLAIIFNNVNAEMAPPIDNKPPWFDRSDMEAVGDPQNNNQQSVWGVIRSPLTVAISEDGGQTWPYMRNIAEHEDENEFPEFSYPSIKQTQDSKIHVAYTYLRKHIQYVSITEEWIKEKEDN